jgi:hypothetical protein
MSSLFKEIEIWVKSVGHYDNNEFDEALAEFSQIADTSKILFNMGVIHATLGEHEKAVRLANIDTIERRVWTLTMLALDRSTAISVPSSSINTSPSPTSNKAYPTS